MAEVWARAEMEGAQVWDRRCIRSLTRLCERLAERTGVSFSTACGNAGRQAAHRIFAHPTTSVAALLHGHFAQTAARGQLPVGAPEVTVEPLLVAQDTTVLNYQTHYATQGLGPIHHQGSAAQGLLAHAALALTPQGLPLGILHLDIWARDPAEHGKKAERASRDTAEKESQKWLDGLRGIEAALPPEQSVLVLADREADVFDYLAAERRPSTHLLVRAQSPRRVRFSPCEGARAPAEAHLFTALEAAPVVGELRVLVPRTREHREREARLELRCLHLWVLPPANRRGKDGLRPVEVWVIQARELAPPAGEAGIEWVLLSTLPVLDGDTAGRLVQYYSRRWGIERLHFTLKSGLRVERLQFDDATSLQHALALCYVVAWRLLWLTYLARLEPEAPAESLLTLTEIQVLSAVSRRPVATRRDAIRAIARLGGFPGNPSAGEPGVKTLWLGLTQLGHLVQGWNLAQEAHSATRQD